MGPKSGPRTHSIPSTLLNHVGNKLVNVGHVGDEVGYVGDEIGQQKRISNFVARIVSSQENKKILLY